MKDDLSGEAGYSSVLQRFRIDVPLKQYANLDYRLEGDLPEGVATLLPVFGTESSDILALNSGGRGILLSDGNKHFRLKGADIDGSITHLVAASDKNKIADVRLASEKVRQIEITEETINECSLPMYQFSGKPVFLLTPGSIEREKHACAALAASYEEKGFKAPYSFRAAILYPTIQWKDKECGTLAFELPSIESDLRFQELYHFAFEHLKFASPEELEALNADLSEFTRKLTTWHGFITESMAKNKLLPTKESHQNQNYVICHVNDTEIGAARVDHTSTEIDPRFSSIYAGSMEQNVTFFAELTVNLLFALELAKKEFPLDKNRFMGYFDNAVKWYAPMDYSTIPGMKSCFESLVRAFYQGIKDPEPIPEKELLNLVDRIAEVEIDTEKLAVLNERRLNLGRMWDQLPN
jgi:hypothetical protein